MANCPSCGAPVTHAQCEDGTHVVLESFEDTSGEGRYRFVKLGPPHIVQPVPASSTVSAHPDHRRECPAHANGLG